MEQENKYIPGGYIIIARALLKSGIMEKPPLFLKLWVWMLIQAAHGAYGNLKRGQLFTSLERMRESMKYWVGASLRRPTKKEIRTACDFLSKGNMIVTRKGTHGMIVTIKNYNFYQTPSNYERHTEGHSDGNDSGTILTRRVNKKEENPASIVSLMERYPDPALINQAFQAIRSTRKSGKISNSIMVNQLQKWSLYPVAQVEAGIRIYLEKGYSDQGKRENYLLGIIRNQTPSKSDNELREPVRPKEINIDEIYAN